MFKTPEHSRTQICAYVIYIYIYIYIHIYIYHQERNHITKCLLQPRGISGPTSISFLSQLILFLHRARKDWSLSDLALYCGYPVIHIYHVYTSYIMYKYVYIMYIYIYGGWSKFLVPQITIFADKHVTLANLSRDQSKTLADHNVWHFGGIFLSNA